MDMKMNLTETIEMPMVGFGTYLIKGKDATSSVQFAIRSGYRHVDTAESYGNEKEVGLGLKAGIDELGLSREQIFVTTKLWPGNAAWGQIPKTTETTIESLHASLGRLGLEYIDLYLIHAPFEKEQRLAQWRGLVELKKMGAARVIGVSNFSETHIDEIKAAGLPSPDADQIELHPWSQKPDLVAYLKKNGIGAIAYSSLVPLPNWRAVAGQDSAKTEEMKADGASENSPFKMMAEKYAVSEAQVLLRWGLQSGYAVLPKSTNEDRIKQNIDLFSIEIDAEDMAAIAQLDRGEGVAWSKGDPTRVA